MSIGHSPGVEPHKPDMKKADSEVTAQDKEEARRKIEGAGAAAGGDTVGLDDVRLGDGLGVGEEFGKEMDDAMRGGLH
jgi:hypothetical protein